MGNKRPSSDGSGLANAPFVIDRYLGDFWAESEGRGVNWAGFSDSDRPWAARCH